MGLVIVHHSHSQVILTVNNTTPITVHHSHTQYSFHSLLSPPTNGSWIVLIAKSHHSLLSMLQSYDIPHPTQPAGIDHNELVQVSTQTMNIFNSFISHFITLQMKIAKDDPNTTECPKDTGFLSLSPTPQNSFQSLQEQQQHHHDLLVLFDLFDEQTVWEKTDNQNE